VFTAQLQVLRKKGGTQHAACDQNGKKKEGKKEAKGAYNPPGGTTVLAGTDSEKKGMKS